MNSNFLILFLSNYFSVFTSTTTSKMQIYQPAIYNTATLQLLLDSFPSFRHEVEKYGNSLTGYLVCVPNIDHFVVTESDDTMQLHLLRTFLFLTKLTFENCYTLPSVPPQIGSILTLRELNIHQCNELQFISPEISKLIHLKTLHIDICHSLQTLPSTIGELAKLRNLTISRCVEFSLVPNEVCLLSRLEYLVLDSCAIESFPTEISEIPTLEFLSFSGNCFDVPLASFRGLPQQCQLRLNHQWLSTMASGHMDSIFGIDTEMIRSSNNFECDLERQEEFGWYMHDLALQNVSVTCEVFNTYFEELTRYPSGMTKLHVLCSKARQRAVSKLFTPGGEKEKSLKRQWIELQNSE